MQEVSGSIPLSSTIADGPATPFPPSRRATLPGEVPPRAPPPRRKSFADLDPVPFPGGAEAALEFAAYEKGLLEHGGRRGWEQPVPIEMPVERHAPISEPDRYSTHWMLAGAGMAVAAAVILLLLSSGLLGTGFAVISRTVALR